MAVEAGRLAELVGEAVGDDPLHGAVVVAAAFEDDLSVLAERFGRAVDGVFGEKIQHAARTRLYRAVPGGGELLGTGGAAELVPGGGGVAGGARGHRHAAAGGKMGDKGALLVRVEARDAPRLARHRGEGEIVGERLGRVYAVVRADACGGVCGGEGCIGERGQDFHESRLSMFRICSFVCRNEPCRKGEGGGACGMRGRGLRGPGGGLWKGHDRNSTARHRSRIRPQRFVHHAGAGPHHRDGACGPGAAGVSGGSAYVPFGRGGAGWLCHRLDRRGDGACLYGDDRAGGGADVARAEGQLFRARPPRRGVRRGVGRAARAQHLFLRGAPARRGRQGAGQGQLDADADGSGAGRRGFARGIGLVGGGASTRAMLFVAVYAIDCCQRGDAALGPCA